MKNLLLSVLIGLMGFAGTSPAFAAGPGWVYNLKITKVIAVASGGINIATSPGLSGCTSQSGYGETFASLYPDHPGIDKIHAIFLAAYMADKTVSIYLHDNTCKVSEVILG